MGAGYAAGPPLGPTAALYLLAASRDATSVRGRERTTVTVGALLAIHVGRVRAGERDVPADGAGGRDPAVEYRVVRRRAHAAAARAARRTSAARAAQAERETERERPLAAAEERARIARDLHDSAGHAINVIGVQAGAARLLQERDPDRSRAALQTIEDVARQTVGDIDRIVHTLRAGDAPRGRSRRHRASPRSTRSWPTTPRPGST